jgi:hypothetical protein
MKRGIAIRKDGFDGVKLGSEQSLLSIGVLSVLQAASLFICIILILTLNCYNL